MAKTAWRCSQCGTVNEAGARACRECGRWPSLFDLQDTAVDDAELEELEPEVAASEEGAPSEAEPPPARRRRLVSTAVAIAVFLTVLVVNLVTSDWRSTEIEPVTPEKVEATAGATTQPFVGWECDVYVVPMDRPSEERAAGLADALVRRAPVKTACTTTSLRLDASAVNEEREQLNAYSAINQLTRTFQEIWELAPSTIVGITELDSFSPDRPDWRFVFGARGSFNRTQGYGVISTARMGSGDDRFRRLETMAMRYLGFLYFGLPESADTSSALYPTILSLDDLDRLEPAFSAPPPTPAQLRSARQRFVDGP